MIKKNYLMAPGPTPVPIDVLLEGAKDTIHHRTPQFDRIFTEAVKGTKEVFRTENDLFILASSGTGAMEMALTNIVNPGEKIIVCTVGKFGERWQEIAKAIGAEIVLVSGEYGDFYTPEMVEKALKENPDAVAVFTTLSETSTGTVMDIEGISKVVKAAGKLIAVDGISGLVAEPCETDKWGLDIVVSGSQKGFMLPPGLAFITVSKAAIEKAQNTKTTSFYFNLKKYLKDPLPWTPAVNLIYQQRLAVEMLLKEGMENVWARHAVMGKVTREAIKAMGLELFSKRPGNVLTSVKVPEGVPGGKIVSIMRDEYGVTIAGGQGTMKGNIFRIAHLGYMSDYDVVIALTALEKVLRKLGRHVEYGVGAKVAMEIFEKEGA
ncbi:MAG: alanine--glyoxylate aminotransferase family protein [Mesotoga sp.]|nr:alanine--glyoxylate aminotransferase family protein [Mesotoga sp.]MDD4478498.1 alanine--glyoxylate aminotransferase family protein [Mesotoga sp.]MDD5745077.1 alanine--glyoxylate aminotransferase family protein [Mesotoga sp.]HPB62642.1 alanine--glyoxylate aminotransferase family protein [Mesotoga sp.]HPI16367.1 alanine--glyoxylate aminotransferase family protein [Mesotoga sp.]